MADYYVIFDCGSRQMRKLIPSHWNISDVKDGFWVDKDLNICHTHSVKFWVPPSKIQYIEKVNKDDVDE